MGVYEARGALGKAMKDLGLRWADAKVNWDDPVSHALESEFIVPLENDLRNTLGAMDHIAAVLSQVQHDCE